MSASDSRDGGSRVEREIREILERADAAQTPVEQMQATVRRQRVTAQARLTQSRNPPWRVSSMNRDLARILGALALAVLAALVGDVSRLLAIVLAIAAALTFFSLWLPGAVPRGPDQPRWRGQDLKGPPSSPIDFTAFRRGRKPPR